MILASAIRFFFKDDTEHKYPQIWTGLRHADIYERLYQAHINWDKDTLIEGFITNEEEDIPYFLDRYSALSEAYECGQVDSETYFSMSMLYSEDMWPEEP